MENKKLRGVPVIVMSRVVGYYSNVKDWGKGKKAEFEDRKEFSTKKLLDIFSEKNNVKS